MLGQFRGFGPASAGLPNSPGSVIDVPSRLGTVHNGGMTSYALSATIDRDFDTTVADVKAALGDQGFGIITEIDMAATLQTKLGVEIDRQVILGACNPGFAHRALQAEPSIGLLLPCNVVVGRRRTAPSSR